jgi:hypothetical protein
VGGREGGREGGGKEGGAYRSVAGFRTRLQPCLSSICLPCTHMSARQAVSARQTYGRQASTQQACSYHPRMLAIM